MAPAAWSLLPVAAAGPGAARMRVKPGGWRRGAAGFEGRGDGRGQGPLEF